MEERITSLLTPTPQQQTPPMPQSRNNGYSSVLSRKSQITSTISLLEAERDEKIEYCQDAKEVQDITMHYKNKIDVLWAEFHSLNKEDSDAE
jgi:hypothetical protein